MKMKIRMWMMIALLCSQHDLCQVQPRFLLALPKTLETHSQRLLQLFCHGWFTLSHVIASLANQKLEGSDAV